MLLKRNKEEFRWKYSRIDHVHVEQIDEENSDDYNDKKPQK